MREIDSLAATLDETLAFIRRYVRMSDQQADAVALWVAHTHAFGAAESTPYLHVTSAERESGKTRLLECLELVAARPIKTGGTTAAALARSVAQDPPPSLLLDETDNALKRDREYVATLLGIPNDGYRRGGCTLLCLPPKWEPTFLPVFAQKVICGLGDLPDTLQSRSVRLELKRRAPGEHISRFRRRDVEAEAEPLAISLTSLADYCLPALEDARPHLPDELGDRAQDVWEPLCAIGDLAGNGWSERARIAAIALSAQRPSDDDSLGVRLLGDIRRAFIEIEADRIATSELLDRLHADEEAPWGDLRGKPVTARSLARMLKPYGIRTNRTVRFDHGTTAKGFHVEQFNDAFIRYLASESVTSVTTAQPSQKPAISIGNNDQACDRSEEAANPHQQRDVTDVTDRSAGTGDERQNGTWPLVVVGDPMYPILLAEAANHGHVTEDEFSVRFELHRRIGEAMRT